MAAPQVQLRRQPRKGELLAGPVVVGKDILELLSTAMYVDPRSILREYVQNAADAIDSAKTQGHLQEAEGRVHLEIRPDSRELVVRDNGVGVSTSEVERVLASFGASSKRGKGLRGFRGVGRLGGLGYARVLTFRTRAPGEPNITEIQWDCRELREQLRPSSDDQTLEETVRKIVTVRRMRADNSAEPHFFEVRLEGVVRLGNDVLLNVEGVSTYLSQVCPLPFSRELRFATEIDEHLGRHTRPKAFCVYVNDSTEPLQRPHTDEFSVSATKRDHFAECELLEFRGLDGQLAATGWILHHHYLGAIKSTPAIRGLRARVGGIQVGDEQIFISSFPESRFNSWVVGELHVLDPRVLPNGRRDDFEHNASYGALVNQLLPVCRDLARRCRVSSMSRSRVLRFAKSEQRAKNLIRGLRLGLTDGKSPRAVERELDQILRQMSGTAQSSLFSDVDSLGLRRRFKRLVTMRKTLRLATEERPEPRVPRAKRRLYRQVVHMILASAPSKRVADLMVRRIGVLLSRRAR